MCDENTIKGGIRMSLNKPLKEITEADLQALIDAQVGERKTIEYIASFRLMLNIK